MLKVLPMAGNPLEREWFVMHLAKRRLPQMSSAFTQFLLEQGQRLISPRAVVGGRGRG
jgi:hypothetical protein